MEITKRRRGNRKNEERAPLKALKRAGNDARWVFFRRRRPPRSSGSGTCAANETSFRRQRESSSTCERDRSLTTLEEDDWSDSSPCDDPAVKVTPRRAAALTPPAIICGPCSSQDDERGSWTRRPTNRYILARYCEKKSVDIQILRERYIRRASRLWKNNIERERERERERELKNAPARA